MEGNDNPCSSTPMATPKTLATTEQNEPIPPVCRTHLYRNAPLQLVSLGPGRCLFPFKSRGARNRLMRSLFFTRLAERPVRLCGAAMLSQRPPGRVVGVR